uniref:Uncharacterized protein n=1 Tax=Avena sativa TaxID=4498 RepID=A0ACD5X932_AVESA
MPYIKSNNVLSFSTIHPVSTKLIPATDHFAQILQPVESVVGTFMKHQRAAAAAAHADRHKKLRRAGEFVCKTCGRSFPTFQALGGHRTSHLRGRHGLALGLLAWTEAAPKKTEENGKPAAGAHRCHVCGVEFEMGQALGGHMRRHREEAGAVPQAPPVLLQLFV